MHALPHIYTQTHKHQTQSHTHLHTKLLQADKLQNRDGSTSNGWQLKELLSFLFSFLVRPIQSQTFSSFLFPSGCQIIIFNQQRGSLSRSNGLIYLIRQQVSTNEKSTSNKKRMNSFPFVFMHNSCTASLCRSPSVSVSEIDYFTSDPSCRYYTPKGKQIRFICIPIHKESHTYSVIPCVFHLNPVVKWI